MKFIIDLQRFYFIIWQVNPRKSSTVTASQTPLLAAARKGHRASVYALINYGADINVKLNDGRTPLWSAAQEGHIDIIKVRA